MSKQYRSSKPVNNAKAESTFFSWLVLGSTLKIQALFSKHIPISAIVWSLGFSPPCPLQLSPPALLPPLSASVHALPSLEIKDNFKHSISTTLPCGFFSPKKTIFLGLSNSGRIHQLAWTFPLVQAYKVCPKCYWQTFLLDSCGGEQKQQWHIQASSTGPFPASAGRIRRRPNT